MQGAATLFPTSLLDGCGTCSEVVLGTRSDGKQRSPCLQPLGRSKRQNDSVKTRVQEICEDKGIGLL